MKSTVPRVTVRPKDEDLLRLADQGKITKKDMSLLIQLN